MSALTDVFSAIAGAIRNKLGVATTYQPSEMATAIASIPSAPTYIRYGEGFLYYLSEGLSYRRTFAMTKENWDLVNALTVGNHLQVTWGEGVVSAYNNENAGTINCIMFYGERALFLDTSSPTTQDDNRIIPPTKYFRAETGTTTITATLTVTVSTIIRGMNRYVFGVTRVETSVTFSSDTIIRVKGGSTYGKQLTLPANTSGATGTLPSSSASSGYPTSPQSPLEVIIDNVTYASVDVTYTSSTKNYDTSFSVSITVSDLLS